MLLWRVALRPRDDFKLRGASEHAIIPAVFCIQQGDVERCCETHIGSAERALLRFESSGFFTLA